MTYIYKHTHDNVVCDRQKKSLCLYFFELLKKNLCLRFLGSNEHEHASPSPIIVVICDEIGKNNMERKFFPCF